MKMTSMRKIKSFQRQMPPMKKMEANSSMSSLLGDLNKAVAVADEIPLRKKVSRLNYQI